MRCHGTGRGGPSPVGCPDRTSRCARAVMSAPSPSTSGVTARFAAVCNSKRRSNFRTCAHCQRIRWLPMRRPALKGKSFLRSPPPPFIPSPRARCVSRFSENAQGLCAGVCRIRTKHHFQNICTVPYNETHTDKRIRILYAFALIALDVI